MTSNEVNFDIPLTPIEDFALSSGGRIRQVCANNRFDQMSPVFGVGLSFLQAIARLRGYQCCVEDLKLGAGSSLPDN